MNSRETNELLTVGGFIKHFFSIIRDNPSMTQADAYEKAEQCYEKAFGKRKYSSWESFRQVKVRYLKKK